MLAKDILGEIQLTVSYVRASIIANLKKRFDEAGIKKYQSFIADISKPAIIPVSYTHLDVYKRQMWYQPSNIVAS